MRKPASRFLPPRSKDEAHEAPDVATPVYYHCAPLRLSPGSVIHPGNWGRVLKLSTLVNGQVDITLLREALLEQARLLYAPEKPSRLNSVFVCPSLEEAKTFRERYQPTQLIYTVTPVEKNAPTFVGDYEASRKPYPLIYFQAMMDFAAEYWQQSETNHHPEILIQSPVRILSEC